MKKLIPNTDKVLLGVKPPVRDTMYVSDLKDSRLKSYQDSVYVRSKSSQKFQSGTKTRPLTSQEKKFWKDDETGLVPNLVEYRNIDGKESGRYFGHYKKPVQPVAYRAATNPVADTRKIQMETTKLDTIPKTTNFEQRIQNPVLKINNKDGTTSTHKMMSFEADGKYYAAPTIVEQNGKLIELSSDDAINYAFKNKEYKEFKTDKEAKDYANNGYKKGTPLSQTPPTPLTKKQYYEVPDANGKITLLTPEQFSRMSSGNKNDLMSKSPIMNKPKYFYEMNSSGKKQLIPESKIREYMQTKNK